MSGVPIRDDAAEQAVLGAMVQSPLAVTTAAGRLRAGDFYLPSHGLIFDTICGIHAHGDRADQVAVSAALDSVGRLAEVGGRAAVSTLVQSCPVVVNAHLYAAIVVLKARQRRVATLAAALADVADVGWDDGRVADLAEQLAEAVQTAPWKGGGS